MVNPLKLSSTPRRAEQPPAGFGSKRPAVQVWEAKDPQLSPLNRARSARRQIEEAQDEDGANSKLVGTNEVLKRWVVRERPVLGSPKVGVLQPGAEINVHETLTDTKGRVWVRCDAGWTNAHTADGSKIIDRGGEGGGEGASASPADPLATYLTGNGSTGGNACGEPASPAREPLADRPTNQHSRQPGGEMLPSQTVGQRDKSGPDAATSSESNLGTADAMPPAAADQVDSNKDSSPALPTDLRAALPVSQRGAGPERLDTAIDDFLSALGIRAAEEDDGAGVGGVFGGDDQLVDATPKGLKPTAAPAATDAVGPSGARESRSLFSPKSRARSKKDAPMSPWSALASDDEASDGQASKWKREPTGKRVHADNDDDDRDDIDRDHVHNTSDGDGSDSPPQRKRRSQRQGNRKHAPGHARHDGGRDQPFRSRRASKRGGAGRQRGEVRSRDWPEDTALSDRQWERLQEFEIGLRQAQSAKQELKRELDLAKQRCDRLEDELRRQADEGRRKHSGAWRLRQENEQLKADLKRKTEHLEKEFDAHQQYREAEAEHRSKAEVEWQRRHHADVAAISQRASAETTTQVARINANAQAGLSKLADESNALLKSMESAVEQRLAAPAQQLARLEKQFAALRGYLGLVNEAMLVAGEEAAQAELEMVESEAARLHAEGAAREAAEQCRRAETNAEEAMAAARASEEERREAIRQRDNAEQAVKEARAAAAGAGDAVVAVEQTVTAAVEEAVADAKAEAKAARAEAAEAAAFAEEAAIARAAAETELNELREALSSLPQELNMAQREAELMFSDHEPPASALPPAHSSGHESPALQEAQVDQLAGLEDIEEGLRYRGPRDKGHFEQTGLPEPYKQQATEAVEPQLDSSASRDVVGKFQMLRQLLMWVVIGWLAAGEIMRIRNGT